MPTTHSLTKRSLLNALLCLTFTLTASACGGCGDEAGGPSTTDNAGSGDMTGGGADMDGANAGSGEEMGDPKAPPTPSYLLLDADPVRITYGLDDEVTLTAIVYDQYDAPMDDEATSWQHAPLEAATQGASTSSWTFTQEGDVLFTACITSAPDICAQRTLLIDEAPPTITITSPTPGEEIDGSIHDVITVRGSVTDGATAKAFLNGMPLLLDAQGQFEASITPTFGVNHIKAEATDDRQQDPSSAELDVLFARDFIAPLDDGTSGVRLEDGLLLHLGQRFFDDDARPMPQPDGAIITRDLADILILLIERIDLLSLVTNPLIDNATIQLSLDRIALNDPTVSVAINDSGIELYLSIPSLELDTQGQLDIEGAILNLTGSVTAGVAILADISIEKPSPNDPFVVEVKALDVAIENATSDFDDDQADAIFTLAESALRLQLESVITQTLDTSFIQAIPELLGDALNGLEASLADQTFSLDAMLGPEPIDIRFSGIVQDAVKEAGRSIQIDIDTSLAAQGAPTKTSLGVATMQPYVPYAVDLIEQGRVQIAVRLGLINGLLHGLWNANFLEINATSLLPEDLSGLVKEARVSAKLPPLLRPPLDGEAQDLILELGQFELDLRTALGDQLVTYGVLLRAGVDLSLEENQLKLTIDQNPQVTIWVIDTEDGRPASLDAEQLTSLFEDILWPQITASLGEGLSLPLPALEISQLGTYAASLEDLTLQFQESGDLEVRDGFLILQANLEGDLPAP